MNPPPIKLKALSLKDYDFTPRVSNLRIGQSISGCDERYRWSAHGVVVGKACHDWQEGEYILKQFGNC